MDPFLVGGGGGHSLMGSYMLYGISVVEIRFSDQPYALSEAVDCCQRGRLLLKNIRALTSYFQPSTEQVCASAVALRVMPGRLKRRSQADISVQVRRGFAIFTEKVLRILSKRDYENG